MISPATSLQAAISMAADIKIASGGEFYGSLVDAVAVFEKGLEEFNPNKTEDLDKHD